MPCLAVGSLPFRRCGACVFDQGRPSRISPTMIEWLVALLLCGLARDFSIRMRCEPISRGGLAQSRKGAKAWTMFEYGRADPARSAHFQNLASRLTHTEVRSRGKCRVWPWLHSLSGDTALAFFDQARPSRIRPTMIEWLVALLLCGLARDFSIRMRCEPISRGGLAQSRKCAKAWTMFEYGRADPARSAHFQNLAARSPTRK